MSLFGNRIIRALVNSGILPEIGVTASFIKQNLTNGNVLLDNNNRYDKNYNC